MEHGVELYEIVEELKSSLELLKDSGVHGVPATRAGLKAVEERARACSACGLFARRKGFGFGTGKSDQDILFVATAPFGNDGEAYSGEAGGLLKKMIKAMAYEPQEVYLAFALKCAPTDDMGDGDLSEGVFSCRGLLLEQIKALSPKVIIALGGVAATALLGQGADVAAQRGETHELDGAGLFVTWGPEELLKAPELKREAWEDLKRCMGLLGKGSSG